MDIGVIHNEACSSLVPNAELKLSGRVPRTRTHTPWKEQAHLLLETIITILCYRALGTELVRWYGYRNTSVTLLFTSGLTSTAARTRPLCRRSSCEIPMLSYSYNIYREGWCCIQLFKLSCLVGVSHQPSCRLSVTVNLSFFIN